MKLPNQLGPIHFIGIGGIGMSGIAEVMHNLGYTVQGSDASDNANVRRLAEKGIRTFVGHRAENLADAALVVVSTAIRRDKPGAGLRPRAPPAGGAPGRDAGRADALQVLRRGGRHPRQDHHHHLARRHPARCGELDPTVINGGIINAYGTNARMGEGDWMVVEADESDGTFLKLPADIAIVTNIDPEHLDHFGSFDAIKDAFRAFIDNIPFYGFAVMCIDHPTVQDLVGRIEDRRIITYGENPQADVRLIDVDLKGGQSRFRVMIRDRRPGFRMEMEDLVLPMPGKHKRAQRHRGAGSGPRARRLARGDPQGAGEFRRRQAPLHPHRRVERRPDLRRLRPSPGRDPGGAEGRPRLHRRPRRRGGAAAPLLAPRLAVRTISAPASTTPTR